MKIVTNVQMKKVGGLGRVFSQFASYVRRSGTPIEIIPLAIGSVADGPLSVSWEPYEVEGTVGWSARMSPNFYKRALAQSRTLEDMRRAMAPLTEAYIRKLEEIQPDVVLINGTYFRPWCLLMAARALGIPAILHYHGSAEQESVGANASARQLARAIESDFADDGPCIFPSELARVQAARSFPISSRQTHIIPNSVPDIFFNQASTREPQALGFVLRWEPVKNTEFLEALFERNEALDEPYRLRLISDLLPAQEAAIAKPHLSFLPPRDTADLAAFYASCGAVMCPSLFETFGNVAAEAVAAGTPALTGRNTGVAEVFQRVGLERLIADFTSPDDVFALVKAIIARGISDDERQRLREALSEDVIYKRLCEVVLRAASVWK
ncbi:MAG TPA: glycosyltransferase family 4 protein [Candidatus Paceibacterota bacterium]|nr:glycosyltransferase family 4 protein [Candidatus Paceibacterota bacterium]